MRSAPDVATRSACVGDTVTPLVEHGQNSSRRFACAAEAATANASSGPSTTTAVEWAPGGSTRGV